MEDRMFELLEKMYFEFQDLKKEMIGFKKEMADFKEDMTSFKDESKNRFQRFETKLEVEVTQKLEALFDGYKADSEKIDELNDKVDNL